MIDQSAPAQSETPYQTTLFRLWLARLHHETNTSLIDIYGDAWEGWKACTAWFAALRSPGGGK